MMNDDSRCAKMMVVLSRLTVVYGTGDRVNLSTQESLRETVREDGHLIRFLHEGLNHMSHMSLVNFSRIVDIQHDHFFWALLPIVRIRISMAIREAKRITPAQASPIQQVINEENNFGNRFLEHQPINTNKHH